MIKVKDMMFTEVTLISIGACKDAIEFCKRNNLFNDNKKIKDLNIEGDFNNYVYWLKSRDKWKFEYDDKGNLIKETNSYGEEYKWEYKDSEDKFELYEDDKLILTFYR